MGDPDSARLVGAYRRLVPTEARQEIARHVPPEVRTRLKRGISDVAVLARRGERRRAEAVLRRQEESASGAAFKAVTSGGRTRLAIVCDAPTPLLARAENQAAVAHALAGAGIDYFAVRGNSDTSAVIGVPLRRRAEALRALQKLCRRRPGYVSLLPNGASRTPLSCEDGESPAVWTRAARNQVTALRLTWFHTDPSGRLVLGLEFGCDVEFWAEEEGRLVAPRRNRAASELPVEDEPVECTDSRFTRLAPADRDPLPPVRTRREFTVVRHDDISFPIDVVYTWVDGEDPAWQRRRAEAAGEAYHPEAANAARYISRDELKYSIRSLRLYAPWVRHIYLVTDDQVPGWLDTSVDGLTVVSHKEIFRDPDVLPTFNSHAIESQLHRIEGLSEHFLYFNDDMFLGGVVTPQDFFFANGISKFFMSPANVPAGAITADDVPVAAAGKNNRILLEERFGTGLTQKMKHVAYPLRRSVLAEIETEYAERHRRTMGNRFRSMDDLSIASSFYHYYAFHTGRAVPGGIKYDYVDLSLPQTPAKLQRMLDTRAFKAFCLNDSVSTTGDLDAQLALIQPFLESYFPVQSRFEKPLGPRPQQTT